MLTELLPVQALKQRQQKSMSLKITSFVFQQLFVDGSRQLPISPCKPDPVTAEAGQCILACKIMMNNDRGESAHCVLLSRAVLLHLPCSGSNTDSVLTAKETSAAGSSTETFLGLFASGQGK